MKYYSAESSAIRAAAKALDLPRKKTAVIEKADILHASQGWYWTEKNLSESQETSGEILSQEIEETPTSSPTSAEIASEIASEEALNETIIVEFEEEELKTETPPIKQTKVPCSTKGTWKRPLSGVTAEIWRICDNLRTRKAVMAECLRLGYKPNTVSQQYFRWRNRIDD